MWGSSFPAAEARRAGEKTCGNLLDQTGLHIAGLSRHLIWFLLLVPAFLVPSPFPSTFSLNIHMEGPSVGIPLGGRAIKKDARQGQITLLNWRFWYLWCIITRDQACSPALLGAGRLLRDGDQKNTALLFGKENWMGNNWNLERTVRKMSFQLGFKV